MARVVVTDHVFDDLDVTRETLLPLGVEVVEAYGADEATLVDLADDAVALIVCYAHVSRAVIRAAAEGGCRVIARTGIGVDSIDIDEAAKLGIQVTNVPDYCLDEVADHTLALLLGALRGLNEAVRTVAAGGWTHPKTIHRLSGRRLALIGVGEIGERVAHRARAFGIEIVGYDPFRTNWKGSEAQPLGPAAEAVSEVDAISLHAPLTEETHHFVNDALLAILKRRPVLVNTSRGGLVDIDAVVRALDDERLAATYLDVTDTEPPPPDHPLLSHPLALLTHPIWASSPSKPRTSLSDARRTKSRALTGSPPRCQVNSPEVARAAEDRPRQRREHDRRRRSLPTSSSRSPLSAVSD